MPVNAEILPAVLRPQGGRYVYLDEAAWPGETYAYELVEVEFSGRRNTYGPFMVNTAHAPEEVEAATDAEPLSSPGPSGYARATPGTAGPRGRPQGATAATSHDRAEASRRRPRAVPGRQAGRGARAASTPCASPTWPARV